MSTIYLADRGGLMEIVEKRENDICILTPVGRLDVNTSESFREHLLQVISDGTKNIILDCQSLDYISSGGLRVVLEGAKRVWQMEGKMVLCSLKEYIKEVFEVIQFDAFLPIAETVEEALVKF
jgi:anti-sigma B factor antagonist